MDRLRKGALTGRQNHRVTGVLIGKLQVQLVETCVGEFNEQQIDHDLRRRNIETRDIRAEFAQHFAGCTQHDGVLLGVDLDVVL